MSIKPTCKEIHLLTSEGMDRPLSFVERSRMRLHLMVCTACRNFTGQMEMIRHAMRHGMPDSDPDDRSS